MEGVETVDVSWLHHSHRDQILRTKAAATEKQNGEIEAESPPTRKSQQQSETPKQSSAHKSAGHTKPQQQQTNGHTEQSREVNGRGALEKPSSEQKSTIPPPSTPTAKGTAPKLVPGRRNSWISSLSSKFSTGSTPPAQGTINGTSPKQSPPVARQDHNPFGASFSPKDKDERNNDFHNPFTSNSPKNPSFLQNAFRKLSSGGSGMGRTPQQSTPCQRRVMNVDSDRDRCKVPELNQAKLKRVAFCVDVEIAGFSTRDDDENPQPENNTPPRSLAAKPKGKEKGEAVALKGPETAVKEIEKSENPKDDDDKTAAPSAADNETKVEGQAKEPTRKQEKKKRSEEERKERKERRRRLAEANGSIPMQLKADEDEDGSRSSTPGTSTSRPRAQSHPTTDPVRIYRRCCQLRETPVLKRLVERMTSPSSTLSEAPGTVAVLDLTDFPMTLPDIVTFSDWLAIVPVRKLILENCALTDEAVRSILAGLLSTKTMQQARSSRRSMRQSSAFKQRPFGIVERLSLKNNPKIGPEGWRHICLFIHLSKSLKAIDLSGVPFPKKLVTANESARSQNNAVDIGTTLSASLSTRFGGDRLEELLLSECQPSTEDVAKICDAASFIGLRRLGLANNNLTREGLEHVCRYFQSGKCEGLDLGGNNLNDHLDVLIPAVNASNTVMALSFADCSLTPASIFPLLQAFPSMPLFRFVDFSHNPALFANQPDSLSMLRRFLPKMSHLKRIHLADVDLSPDHAIALAEVLPECPSLCHLNILENPRIASLASSTDPASQEEACAVYASLMAAVRVSHTLIAVDIEVPSAESSEVVKALASQIVAYSLRNLGAIEDIGGADQAQRPAVQVPEVLQHIVGYGDGTSVSFFTDEPAPDEDYVIGGTGVVKALGVCLGNVDRHHAELGGASRSGSGRSTPVHRVSTSISSTTKKPRDMSKNLLGSARNIQARIQKALVQEDKAGNDSNYRRLQFLDHTLQKMIKRFEEEYPECCITPAVAADETFSLGSSEDNQEAAAVTANLPADIPDNIPAEDEEADPFAIRLSRKSSNTSLHSRALTSEEGRIHRIGQNLRRDFLEPSLISSEQGLAPSGDESHVHALRDKLKGLKGDEIRSRVESVGADKALQELGSTVEELWIIQQQDQDAFQKFKESQIAAQINGGLRPPSSQGEKPSPST